MIKKTEKTLLGYTILTGSIFFEVIMWILIEYGISNVAPAVYGAYYLLSVCIFVTPIYLIRYKPKKLINSIKTHKSSFLKITILMIITTLLFFYIISFTGSTSMSLISKLTIVFSAILGIKILKEKVNSFELFGVILTFLGAIVLSLKDFQFLFIPILLGTIYAGLWSLASYYVKKELSDVSMWIFIFVRTWGMAIGLTLFVILTGQFEIPEWSQIFVAFIAGLCGTYGAALLYFQSHKYLRITTLNAFGAISPIFVGVAAYFVFDQIPDQFKITGGAMIIFGAIFIILFRPKKKDISY